MKPTSPHRFVRNHLLATAIASMLAGHAARAEGVTYDTVADGLTITGGPGTWDESTSNWTTDNGASNVPWANANNDTAIFGDVAGTVTLATPITVGGLTFNTAGYILTGETLSFGASGMIDTAADASINSVLAGSFLISKTGVGTLTLGGANSHDGGTNLDGGVLALGGSGALGTTGTLSFNGGALQFSSSNTQDYSSRFSTADGQAYLLDTNGESVTLATALSSTGGILTKTGPGTLTLAAANTYDGTTTVSAGFLNLSHQFALQNSTLATGGLGIVFDASVGDHAFTFGGLSGSANLVLLDNALTPSAVTLSIGANGADTTYTGALSGAGALTKVGGGTLSLTGVNTYTGATIINEGILKIGGSGKLGNGSYAGAIAIASGAAIDFNSSAAHTLSGAISGDGSLTKSGAGALTLNGTIALTGGVAINGDLIFDSSSAQTWSSAISGSGGINKKNTGTLTLAGANTYTGVTSFATGGSAGTLVATTLADGGVSGVGTANSLGLSSNAASNLLIGGGTTLKYTGPAASTDRSFTMNANTTTQVFTLDASGTGPIQFTSTASPAFETSSTRTHTLGLSGSNTGDNIFAANVANAGSGATSLTKSGRGTWVLTGTSHAYTGGTIVNQGTLKLDAGIGGSLAVGGGLSLGTTTSGGGTFVYDNTTASGATSQTFATLTTTIDRPADNILQLTRTALQPVTLTFTTLATSNSNGGNNVNFVLAGTPGTNGTDSRFVITDQATGTQITRQNAYFNGGDFAWYDATGFVRGIKYGSDTGSTTISSGTFTASNHQEMTASISGQPTKTLGVAGTSNGTLKIAGASDLTLAANATLTLAGKGNNGAVGILKTGGGTSTIGGSGTAKVSYSVVQMDFRVDGTSDVLVFNIPVDTSANVRSMKSGAGTAIFNNGLKWAAFTQNISGGVLEIGGGGTITGLTSASILNIASGAKFKHNSSASLTYPAVIQGSGGMTVNAGILSLSAANTYTGATSVTGGALSFLKTAAQPATGTTTVAAGATLGLGVGGTGYFSSTDVDSLWGNTFSKVTMDPAAIVGIDTTAGDFTYATSQSTRGLTKLGSNTLTLTGTSSYSGPTSVIAGTLKLGAVGSGADTPLGTIAAGTTVSAGAALDLNGFSLATDEALTLNGTGIASGGALTNSSTTAATYSGLLTLGSTSRIVATSGDIILSNPGTITGSGFGLTLDGTTTGSNIASVIGTGTGTLTKTGAGTWTLSAINTYTGDTTVSAGTLVLADNAGLKFVVTDGANNKITGTGTATLNGDFTIDTSGVTVTIGTWTLVDVASKSFTGTFTVAGVGWSETSNVWTKVDGTKTWTFTEADGKLVLTVTASGSTYTTWASGLANTAFDFDSDNNGIANGLQWILGGTQTQHDVAAIAPLEALDATYLQLTFKRVDASVAETTLTAEWDVDLAGPWSGVPINETTAGTYSYAKGVTVKVVTNGAAPDDITVKIPRSNAAPGTTLFARLKATQP